MELNKINWFFFLTIEHSTSLGKSFADNFTRLQTHFREKSLRCKLKNKFFINFYFYLFLVPFLEEVDWRADILLASSKIKVTLIFFRKLPKSIISN